MEWMKARKWWLVAAGVVIVAVVVLLINQRPTPPTGTELEQAAVTACEKELRAQDIPVPDSMFPSRKSALDNGTVVAYEVTSDQAVCQVMIDSADGAVIAVTAEAKL